MISANKTFLALNFLLMLMLSSTSYAGGGYFSTGYGPVARQTTGAVTAVAEDAYAGASNPAKLSFAGNRLEFGLEIFNPHRRVSRKGATGANSVYNFSSRSKNPVFFIPEFAYARQFSEKVSWGFTIYANGGLNSEYLDTTGIPGTNGNPTVCGTEPGNFFLGCGRAGFDLMQLIFAPTMSYKLSPNQSIGVSPLIALQRFESFGLNAFSTTSLSPSKVSNRGYEHALGAGVRIGWFNQLTPWLSVGAAYSSKVYMQDFEKYEGLFAEGSFDIPANYNFGIAIKPISNLKIALDVQRIEYSKVNALANSVQNTLRDPLANPLGSATGSGFGWDRDETNYKIGLAYRANSKLTLRAGFAYGKRPNNDTINAVSFSLLTPNPTHQYSLGVSWKSMHFAFTHFVKDTYKGPSALFPGATESVTPYVNALSITYSIIRR